MLEVVLLELYAILSEAVVGMEDILCKIVGVFVCARFALPAGRQYRL